MPKCGKCGKPDATVEEIRACYQGSVSAVGVGSDGKIVTVLDQARAVENGEAPSGSVVMKLTGPDSLSTARSFVPVTEDGFYSSAGSIYKVVTSQQGRLYAKLLRVIETPYGPDGDNLSANSATWEYAPGVMRALNALDRLTEEAAREFGQLYGVCCICGRTLTNEESIAAGIGPICAGKQGW